jgi:ABC-type dipeptide/oligopeptide/nickel transport system ATPase component
MQNNQTSIGEIDSINGNVITIRLFDNIKSHMPIIDGIVYRVGQIGSFLKIPLGYANLYGIVTQIGSAAVPEALKETLVNDYENAKNTHWLGLVLVGEQIGKKFERGITQFPTTSDKVHLVTINDLDVIYGGLNDDESITVGNISASESLSAKLDLNKLVSRHCAIVGSTGSGKSNTVAILLEAIAKRDFKSSRILMIDPHGEYNEVLKKQSKVYKINASDNQNELYIPFWALPFNELMQIFSNNLSDVHREYIREKIVEKKVESITINNLDIETEIVTADSPIPFSLKQLWFELDDIERQTFNIMRQPESITNIIVQGDANLLKSNEYEVAGSGNSDIYFEYEEIKTNRAVKELKITIIQNAQSIKKEFLKKKNELLKSSTKHKQIAQEQIKRLMSRNKEKIKEPLKYEQKLFRMFLNGTLIYDKDLQLIIDELDAKIFADIGKK